MNDLIGKNIVVYDLEIKKPIEECTYGWKSLNEMGISVGCAFDYRINRYRVFMDDNLQELVSRLNEPNTLIVAFNHVGFDNKLLRETGYGLKGDNELNNYDMLLISRAGAKSESVYSKGFKLDDHLRACGLPMKTGSGELAPKLWKENKIGSVVDYCLNDVTQEKNLFEYIMKTGKMACAYRGDYYEVDLPGLLWE